MPDALAEDASQIPVTEVGATTMLLSSTINSLESAASSNDTSSSAVNFGPNKVGSHSGHRAGFSTRCLTRKPLEVVHAEEDEGVLERTLGFWDLFALGFGGTVGRLVCSRCVSGRLTYRPRYYVCVYLLRTGMRLLLCKYSIS